MKSPEFVELTRRHYHAIDVPLAHLVKRARDEGATIPCKRGCDACCYEPVHVAHFELAALIDRLRSFPAAELDEIERRIAQWFAGMEAAGLDPALIPEAREEMLRYHRARLACPLLDLDRHECRVYSDRPFGCRGYYLINQDPSVCGNRAEVLTVQTLDCREVAAVPVMSFLSKWGKATRREDVIVVEATLAFWLREAWPVIRDRSISIVEWMKALELRLQGMAAVLTPKGLASRLDVK